MRWSSRAWRSAGPTRTARSRRPMRLAIPWQVVLAGSELDLRPTAHAMQPAGATAAVPRTPQGPAKKAGRAAHWQVWLNFQKLDLAASPAPDFSSFALFRGRRGRHGAAGEWHGRRRGAHHLPFRPGGAGADAARAGCRTSAPRHRRLWRDARGQLKPGCALWLTRRAAPPRAR